MTTPTAFEDRAQDVLAAVSEAGELMASAGGDVPEAVERLVDQFDVLLAADQARSGLAGVDPYLGEALLAGAVVCLKALRDDNAESRRRRVRLGLEQVRQALRDIVDAAPSSEARTSKEVVRWLAETLSIPQARLAALLGVSHRTLQRWLAPADQTAPEGDDEARVRAVALIANHLRHIFTGPGVIRWFERPHPGAGGHPPLELLHDPLALPQLVRLASQARSTTAS